MVSNISLAIKFRKNTLDQLKTKEYRKMEQKRYDF